MQESEFSSFHSHLAGQPDLIGITIHPCENGQEYRIFYKHQEFVFCSQEDAWRFVRYIHAGQPNEPRKTGIARQRELLQRALRNKKRLETSQVICRELALN